MLQEVNDVNFNCYKRRTIAIYGYLTCIYISNLWATHTDFSTFFFKYAGHVNRRPIARRIGQFSFKPHHPEKGEHT